MSSAAIVIGALRVNKFYCFRAFLRIIQLESAYEFKGIMIFDPRD